MFKCVKYVLTENATNLYRTYCIAKYELLADMRDSMFGMFWNFASPAIQVLTYWFIFGVAWHKKPMGDIPYLPWVVVGFSIWWFLQPCIQNGCTAVFSKTNVITRMKFPVSILPTTTCAREFFNHGCMLVIMFVTIFACGYRPHIYWLWMIYYAVSAFIFAVSVSMILSVLTMLWRDMKKLVTSLMRMLMYMSPVIWECQFDEQVPYASYLNKIMKLNPINYIVNGYREAVFYCKTPFDHPVQSAYFWLVTIVLFWLGCALMYRFKTKFIDLL